MIAEELREALLRLLRSRASDPRKFMPTQAMISMTLLEVMDEMRPGETASECADRLAGQARKGLQ